jgi:hypothetical protein
LKPISRFRARKLAFAYPENTQELARRGETLGTAEARQMVEYAIETGGE